VSDSWLRKRRGATLPRWGRLLPSDLRLYFAAHVAIVLTAMSTFDLPPFQFFDLRISPTKKPADAKWSLRGWHFRAPRRQLTPGAFRRFGCSSESPDTGAWQICDLPASHLSEEFEYGCPRCLSGFGVVSEPSEFGALWQISHIEPMTCVGVHDCTQFGRGHAFCYSIA
jgi:hypothetical protein